MCATISYVPSWLFFKAKFLLFSARVVEKSATGCNFRVTIVCIRHMVLRIYDVCIANGKDAHVGRFPRRIVSVQLSSRLYYRTVLEKQQRPSQANSKTKQIEETKSYSSDEDKHKWTRAKTKRMAEEIIP